MFYSIVSFVLVIIPCLLCMGFTTLLERKILGYIQYRKGPNKVSFLGLLQPFLDAVKLFTKDLLFLFTVNFLLYIFMPLMCLMLSLVIWMLFPFVYSGNYMLNSIICMFMIMSLFVYPLLLMGWSSNSHYSYLGSIRGVSQVLSYEVVFSLMLLFYMYMMSGIMLDIFMSFSNIFSLFYLFPFFPLLWVVVCLCETNRSPFDFSEGESELVSGFNTEYGGGLFSMIFMSEYLNIIFFSFFLSIFFFSFSGGGFFILGMSFVNFWLWFRGTYPRHRYDLLMLLCWKSLMPIFILFIVCLLVFMFDL